MLNRRLIKIAYVVILTLLIALCVSIKYYYQDLDEHKSTPESIEIEPIDTEEDNFIEELEEELFNENILEELNEYVEDYDVSVYYETFDGKYQYQYDIDEVYYGASLIKLVDTLYLIDNKIDLDTKIKYNKAYGASICMDNRQINDFVSLYELIMCALTVSDNSAHQLLINYIGYYNLKNYANNLGAINALIGSDNFGSQSASDMMIFLKRLNIILEDDNNLFIKEAMLNTNDNYLNFDDVSFYHKYGEYNNYYHDVGINYDDEYYLVILSRENKNKEVITKISKMIYELNNYYLNNN